MVGDAIIPHPPALKKSSEREIFHRHFTLRVLAVLGEVIFLCPVLPYVCLCGLLHSSGCARVFWCVRVCSEHTPTALSLFAV